ncbi:hypothetical protein ACO2Q8_16595 [Larkinella sp. VNQ87]|uniref:hypothetical protein n=1 Tax=Larkinella sp. VNQ87 TaxID=3400921 RepID=UPI003C0A1F6A
MASSPNTSKGEGFVRTYDLLTAIIEDANKAFELLASDQESQFLRRIAIRNVFTYIEASVQIIKFEIKSDVRKNRYKKALSEKDVEFLNEERIKSDGTKEGIMIQIQDNLKGTFKLAKKIWGLNINYLDCSGKQYRYFLKAKHTRNKLTHPRTFYDIEITDDDVSYAAVAFQWTKDGFIKLFEAKVSKILETLPKQVQTAIKKRQKELD